MLDRAVELYPDYVPAAGRPRRPARPRRQARRDAVRDAEDALLRDTRPPNLYQVGCIYALTSKTHPEDAPRRSDLLWAALRTGFGLDLVDTDPDLDPLRADPEFKRAGGRREGRQAELTSEDPADAAAGKLGGGRRSLAGRLPESADLAPGRHPSTPRDRLDRSP